MAVTNDGLIKTSFNVTGTPLEGIRKSFTRVYKMTSTDVVTDDETAVMAALGINMFSVHPAYSFAWVTNVSGELVETLYRGAAGPNGALWNVTVEYNWIDPLLRETDGNPLNAPILWDIKYETEDDPLYEDVNGDPTATP